MPTPCFWDEGSKAPTVPLYVDRVMNINIRGVFVTTQAALKHRNDGGRIINIDSAVGERVQVPGLVPYSATKGAALSR